MREVRRWIETKFGGRCCDCGDRVYPGTLVLWFPNLRRLMCQACGEDNYGG